MTAQLLLGDPIAARLREETRARVAELAARGVRPRLVSLFAGENAGIRLYLRKQAQACAEVGIEQVELGLPAEVTREEFRARIEDLNRDPAVHAMILHTPLPEPLDVRGLWDAIDPRKDAECMHPFNLGSLLGGTAPVTPCTPMAAVELLRSVRPSLRGAELTIAGHSTLVGKPLALLLLESKTEAPTITVCHVATRDFAAHVRRAEVLIVAAGKPGLIRGDMLRPGCVVIDIGQNVIEVRDAEGRPVLNENGKPRRRTVGDVDFEEAKEVCSWITPVPGGVGPVTVTLLLRNVAACARLALGAPAPVRIV